MPARLPSCGDGIVQSGETCDDGNDAGLDGCSSSCTLESGYMCYSSVRRNIFDAGEAGVRVLWGTGNPRMLNVSGTAEACTGEKICKQDSIAWQPELWAAVYNRSSASLPPAGFYCSDFCEDTFEPPFGHEFKGSCQPRPVDECVRGLTECDENAYCLEPADGIGYSCRCDADFFASDFRGRECQRSGVELVFNISGGVNTAEAVDRDNIAEARGILIAQLLLLGFIDSTKSSVALVEEGVADYPPDMVFRSMVGIGPQSALFDGRSLWRLILRIPVQHANVDLFMSSERWNNYDHLTSQLLASDKYRLLSVQCCDNDKRRTCTSNADCVKDGVCSTVADTSVRIMTAGGSTAPLSVTTSSSEIISIEYDTRYSAFKVRIRYDNTVPGTMDIVYVSRLAGVGNQQALAFTTLNPSEFPCLSTGVGLMEQRRESNVCCLDRFYNQYSTTREFGDFLANDTLNLRAEINQQGSCTGFDTPPNNRSMDLLNTSFDFVEGMFARSTRSYVQADVTPTRGYKDLNLFLSLEDVENHFGTQSPLPNGNRLRFFVGTAHVKPTKSSTLIVRNSQTEVLGDITTSYVFTTQASIDFTFVKEVSVSLSEVMRRAVAQQAAPVNLLSEGNRSHANNSNTTLFNVDETGRNQFRDVTPLSVKFATIRITVPDTVTGSDVNSIIPLDSLKVLIGYNKNEAARVLILPCRELYQGSAKEDLDAFLAGQDWCAPQDPICEAQGPLAVGPGGSIQFTLPLPEDAWDSNTLVNDNGFFSQNVYIDFMLMVSDKDGKKSMSNVQTQTAIKSSSITRLCQEERISSNIEDVFEIDMFLGLASNESDFETALVQSLDVTHQRTPLVLKRDISSKASNVLTVLFRGEPKLFEQSYAAEYTLAVEDVITLHFLNLDKKAEAEQLIAAGRAFTQTNTLADDSASLTTMKLEPSEALLEICPLQASRGMFGCIARREIRQRTLEFQTNSIVALTGRTGEDEKFSLMRAGLWAQKNFGGSRFIKDLASKHSKVMRGRYQLNSRFRKGFLISPTVPWRQADLDAENSVSVLDLAQHSITTMLVALDTNIGQEYEAKSFLTIPLQLPLSAMQIIEQQVLLAAAYALGAGLDPSNVYIDVGSIVENGVAGVLEDTEGMPRQRRLLQSEGGTSSEFNMIAGFTSSNEEVAIAEANLFRATVVNRESIVSVSILETMNAALVRAIPLFVSVVQILSLKTPIQKAASPQTCLDDKQWEMDVTTPLQIDLGLESGKKRVGFISCQGRHIKLIATNGTFPQLLFMNGSNTTMAVRGPMNASNWLMLTRSEVLERSSARTKGWSWWDFCAAPPRLVENYTAAFMTGWNNIRTMAATRCCLCNDMPMRSGTKTLYKHSYTWPIRIDNETIFDAFTNISYELQSTAAAINSDIFKINPQLRNFRVAYGANVSLFRTDDSEVLPPEAWDIDDMGRTLFPNCGPSSWRKNKYKCQLCDVNTFRLSDILRFPNTTDAFKRGGVCTNCPANTASGLMSTKVQDCVCTRGYSFVANACVLCPANTYKDTLSNVDLCASCGIGFESRSGSTDISKCVKPISMGQYDTAVPVYTRVLGLIYLERPVETHWLTPLPFYQDQTMLCVLMAGGVSIDCGRGVYTNVFASTPIKFANVSNTVQAIELVKSAVLIPGSARANILSFHSLADGAVDRVQVVLTPRFGTQFVVKGVDRYDLTERVKQVSLFPRPGYMGPAPPGFVEKIIDGVPWIRGMVVRSALRLRIANNNLVAVNAGNDAYMVSFITTQQLDTTQASLDWQWIVCGRKSDSGSSYDFCKDEADPDNPAERNSVNPYVLDGNIVRLNGGQCCDSCYVDYEFMMDCKKKSSNPNRINMFDNAFEWIPFLNMPPPDDAGTFWLYTFFMNGQSTACLESNCNEAAVYRNMPLHFATDRSPTWGNSIDFLPGTIFSYRVPMPASTKLKLYSNVFDFLSMFTPEQRIPINGIENITFLTLEKKFAGHACSPGTASTLICNNNGINTTGPVQYDHDLMADQESAPIMEYTPADKYADTKEITYCYEVCTFIPALNTPASRQILKNFTHNPSGWGGCPFAKRSRLT